MILKNRIAVITGAQSGIGLATAFLFATEGAETVLVDIRDAGREVEKIQQKGGSAHFCRADISNPRDVKALFEKTRKKYGCADILVNNAGIVIAKKATETSEAEWDRLLSVNLKGTFLCSKEAILHMRREKKGGVIINIASELGLVGGTEIAAYCASKGGMVQLTRAMALDHVSENIRVNCVCPGPIQTPLLEEIFASSSCPEKEREHTLNMVPMGRLGRPEEIAQVILFLASDKSSFMTGAIVAVDGGWCAR